MPLQVPCGQCAGCRLERSRQWALRIMHEAEQHDRNSFLTLTYDDDLAPDRAPPLSLRKDHLQKFFKRARKAGLRFRYYACGEYGEAFGRPHYHVCMFGEDFSDESFPWPFLRSLWTHGNVQVDQLEFESAAYVARYCMKKMNGERAFFHYMVCSEETGELVPIDPEFAVMSRGNQASKGQPSGIGASWFGRFLPEVVRDDSVIATRSSGHYECRPPRYYDQLLELRDPEAFAEVKARRRARAKQLSDADLEVKRVILESRLSRGKRSYEL